MRLFPLFVASLLILGCRSGQSSNPPVDTLYHNAAVWTGDAEQPWAQAFAVRGDRIIAVGLDEALRETFATAERIIDLDGHFVTPGFRDSHTHLSYAPAVKVDLNGVGSLAEFRQRISAFADSNPDLEWIEGFGWDYAAFPDRRPLAEHLDGITGGRPAFVMSRDGHMGLANTTALEVANVVVDTPDPQNGRIVRDPKGRATGELQESAMNLVRDLIPSPTPERRREALAERMREAASHGITAIHEAGVTAEIAADFAHAQSEDALLQRVDLALRMLGPDVATPDTLETHIREIQALQPEIEGPMLRVRSVKGMLDGTIDATTAAMFDPYVGTSRTGLLFWNPQTLNSAVARYDEAGLQVLLHAIGDRTIAVALDAFESAAEQNGPRERRHRLEHAEMPRLEDIGRTRELGVVASTQPMFAYPDATVLKNFAPLLGPKRAQHADNFALWDDAGVRQVFGSDSPVMTLSVLSGIEAAATRQTEDRTPPDGWYPAGRIPVEDALRHYTTDAAWAAFAEDRRGTLAPGYLADFVVLSQNILEIEPSEISETKVLLTVLGGRVTYRNERSLP